MHVIRKRIEGGWVVGYFDKTLDGVHFHFAVVVTCPSMLIAAEICSWLNGGAMPSFRTLEKAGFAA